MGDIYCRVCGEPWDCTGGLHHTHVDMPKHHYDQLIRGVGCPACKGTNEPSATDPGEVAEQAAQLTSDWRHSILASSDDTEPYPGFFGVEPWDGLTWADELPHWLARLEPADFELLEAVAGPYGESLIHVETRDSQRYYVGFDPNIVALPGSSQMDPRDRDLVEVNARAILAELNALHADGRAEYRIHQGQIQVRVADIDEHGEIVFWSTALGLVRAYIETLGEYPCLDEAALSKSEQERSEQDLERVMDKVINDADWFGGPAVTLKAMMRELKLFTFDQQSQNHILVPDIQLRLFRALGMPAYHALQAVIDENVWLFVPETEMAWGDEAPAAFKGILVRHGQRAEIETLPGSEFWQGQFPNGKSFECVPDPVLNAVVNFLS